MTSLYDELGVEPTATKDEIKKAYRKKAKENHPDKGGDSKKFQRIVKAYMILSDDISRARYNRTGDEEEKPKVKQDFSKLSKTFLMQVVFTVIDTVGDTIDKKNLKKRCENQLLTVERDLNERIKRAKETYKALKKKRLSCEEKLKYLKSLQNNQNFLIEAITAKIKYIDATELLPLKEELYKLFTDKRVLLAAGRLLKHNCFDFKTEEAEDPLKAWDRQMAYGLWGTSTDTTPWR